MFSYAFLILDICLSYPCFIYLYIIPTILFNIFLLKFLTMFSSARETVNASNAYSTVTHLINLNICKEIDSVFVCIMSNFKHFYKL